jgi:peptide/nickel transport system permease protein
MGTENFGRDVLSRFLNGTRVSMFVAVGAITFGLVLGTLLGMLAGLRGGSAWDTLIMRGMDVLLAFPLLVLVPVLAGILQTRTLQIGPLQLSNIAVVGLAIGFVYIPVFARVARGSVLAEVREDYILAARSFGVRTRGLLFGNLLPNILSPLIVQAAFSLAQAIVIEAAVSFLGLGVQPPDASWGNMLADARRYVVLGSWWLVVFPSLAIAIAVLSFNLLGDALRDALDPRSVSSASLFEDLSET